MVCPSHLFFLDLRFVLPSPVSELLLQLLKKIKIIAFSQEVGLALKCILPFHSVAIRSRFVTKTKKILSLNFLTFLILPLSFIIQASVDLNATVDGDDGFD